MLSNSQYNINNNKSYYLFSTNYEPGAVQSILYTFAHLILIPVEVSTLTNEVAEAIFSPDLSSGLLCLISLAHFTSSLRCLRGPSDFMGSRSTS